jgi:anti-anti-sigma factor
MELTVKARQDGILRMQVVGRVVYDALDPKPGQLADLLGSEGYAQKVLVDLGGVDFIDSSGLSWLLVSHKRFREAGGRLVLHSLQPMVLDVVKVLRLDKVFALADNERAALDLVREGKT